MGSVLAIIPARSGSKSVKDKNIRLMDGKPMIAYSIEHAQKANCIDRIIVSTDSEEYAAIARKYGAETPFLRPAEYATDTALDYDVFLHALNYLEEVEGYIPELVVQLRPTYPIRRISDIENMVNYLREHPEIDSMRCVAPAKEVAYKMWHMDGQGMLSPIMKDIPECYNMPRQQLPKVYYQNACIDVVRTEVITKKHSMSGCKIAGYEMSDNFDIDTEEEFEKAEEYLKITHGNKTFVFDIDGVIAQIQKDLDYALSEPNERMINIINRLYDCGNKIVLFTARGYVTGKDWSKVTEEQMKRWGVKYHELKFGKPNADYYVDDKMLSMDRLYGLAHEVWKEFKEQ